MPTVREPLSRLTDRAAAPPVAHFRADVEGLRAVAVLAVIAGHAIGLPAGGYLGVDVFFVISGFVITAMLLREQEATGRVSLAAFYLRRVKRLLPASVVVIVATVAVSLAVFESTRLRETLLDAGASLLGIANWRFALEDVDYWAQHSGASPLQHYWSLGVEEQFYLIWPVALLACLGATWLAPRRRRRLLAFLLGIAIAGSLAWAVVQGAFDAPFAYFSSLTRAWELGVGAMLALGSPLWARIPDRWRPALAWVGIAGLGAALLLLGEGAAAPVPAAMLPVVATAVIIVAGTGGATSVWPLENAAARYIGRLSFSLYLWHFPMVVFLAPMFAGRERFFLLVVLALTGALAMATYHWIERPLRRASWRPRLRGPLTWRVAAVGVAAALVVLALPAQLAPREAAAAGGEPVVVASEAELSDLLVDALGRDEWPALSPSVEQIGIAGMPEEDTHGCSEVDLADPDACWFPNEGAARTAVVMGDSTAIVAMPMIRAALGSAWNVKGLTMAACYQVEIPRWYDDAEHRATCEAHQGEALSAAENLAPDLIVVSNLYTGVWHLEPAADALTGGGSYQWALATADLTERLTGVADHVVFLASPPRREPISECAVPGVLPEHCVHEVDDLYREVTEGEAAAVTAEGGIYVPTERWFCYESRCPAFVSGTLTMRDGIHVTRQYATQLAPLLRQRLDEAGLAVGGAD